MLTRDSAINHQFYTEIMNFKFISAVREDSVPSTAEETSFLHTFYALEDGSCMAFFELAGVSIPEIDDQVPKWVRHFAMNVDSYEELASWKERLESHGVETIGITDHEGIWQSIYFFDPNGIRLELTWQRRELDDNDRLRGEQLLKEWTIEHQGQ